MGAIYYYRIEVNEAIICHNLTLGVRNLSYRNSISRPMKNIDPETITNRMICFISLLMGGAFGFFYGIS